MKPSDILASAVDAAYKIRESSYDHQASDAAVAKAAALYKADPDSLDAFCVDYAEFYKKTEYQAAEEAAAAAGDPELATPVYLLMRLAPNDALEWATTVIAKQVRVEHEKEKQ